MCLAQKLPSLSASEYASRASPIVVIIPFKRDFELRVQSDNNLFLNVLCMQ